MTDIAVLGAGAFGTALAISLAASGTRTTLIGRDAQSIKLMQAERTNRKYLANAPFPEDLVLATEIPSSAQTILLAVPTQKAATALQENRQILKGKTIVACFKGIELETGRTATSIINETCDPIGTAILSGPSFAADIAMGMPTALTIATADDRLGESLQTQLSTDNLRLYRTTDVCGVEFGGALKNVVAIAAGLAIGAGLGESARAALITRGFAEMTRFAVSQGATQKTLAGLSGFGDLVLTCTSKKSRNYAFGISKGSGAHFDPTTTVEGIATAKIVARLADKAGQDMPITSLISNIVDGKTSVREAQDILLSRPLRKE